MAIKDAYILSNLLGKCGPTADLATAFVTYDVVRVPRALRVASRSREHGKALHMEGVDIMDDLERLTQ
jgi:salicylate hydroxylase